MRLIGAPQRLPEIDGIVSVKSAKALKPGDWADVEIASADAYDLHARFCTRSQ